MNIRLNVRIRKEIMSKGKWFVTCTVQWSEDLEKEKHAFRMT